MTPIIDKIKLALSWFSWTATYALMFIFSFLVRVRPFYEDQQFSSVKRPLIVISNHRGIFDPWLISFALPFKILFGRIFPLRPYSSLYFAKGNTLGQALKLLGIMKLTYFIYNTISIPDAGSFEEKVEPLVEALKNNQSVLFFPEGRLISDENILEFKKGVVKIHQITGAQILPVAIRYERKPFPFGRVFVAVGRSFSIPTELIENSAYDFQAASEYLREKVLNLYERIEEVFKEPKEAALQRGREMTFRTAPKWKNYKKL